MVSGSGNQAAWSINGIDWTAVDLPALPAQPAGGQWADVIYGDGKFVTVAFRTDRAAWSTDGIDWHQTVLPSFAYWRDVTYGGGKFVAIASSAFEMSEGKTYEATAAWSADGITWNAATLPPYSQLMSVTYGEPEP
jgi:hypothetical protein